MSERLSRGGRTQGHRRRNLSLLSKTLAARQRAGWWIGTGRAQHDVHLITHMPLWSVLRTLPKPLRVITGRVGDGIHTRPRSPVAPRRMLIGWLVAIAAAKSCIYFVADEEH